MHMRDCACVDVTLGKMWRTMRINAFYHHSVCKPVLDAFSSDSRTTTPFSAM